MRYFLMTVLLVLGFGAAGANGQDQCLTCHQAAQEAAHEAHQNCLTCHEAGADEHLADFKVSPEPVAQSYCVACHEPNDDFMSISAHQMEMECVACHTIHDR